MRLEPSGLTWKKPGGRMRNEWTEEFASRVRRARHPPRGHALLVKSSTRRGAAERKKRWQHGSIVEIQGGD